MSTIEGAATKIVTSVAAMLAGAWVLVHYVKGRIDLKKTKLLAASNATTTVSAQV